MSIILTLTGHSSILSIDFQPPIQLDQVFGLALLSFHSYNSIPNIEKGSKFYLKEKTTKKLITIEIPEGSYEIGDIEKYILENLKTKLKKEISFTLKPNNNTLKCELYSDTFDIDFNPSDCIRKILGFSKNYLKAGKQYSSDLSVDIIKVRTIHIDTNITSKAFYNDKPSHTIYEFAVAADPGFAIDETPQHLIYLPVSTTEIHNITLKILDQDSELVDFRGEKIIVRLELRPL